VLCFVTRFDFELKCFELISRIRGRWCENFILQTSW